MGWCSGTHIFDAVADEILDSKMSKKNQERVLLTLAEALEALDWDCQYDTDFGDHPIVVSVMQQLGHMEDE